MPPWTKALTSSKGKLLLNIHVVPGAKKAVFPVGYNPWRNSLEMKVQAEAQHNKANNEIIAVIAAFFDIKQNHISINSGKNSREKTIAIVDADEDIINNKLGEVFHEL